MGNSPSGNKNRTKREGSVSENRKNRGANLQRDDGLSNAVDRYIKNFKDFKDFKKPITRNEFTRKGKLIEAQFGRLQNALSVKGKMPIKDFIKLKEFYQGDTANIITNNIEGLSFYKNLRPDENHKTIQILHTIKFWVDANIKGRVGQTRKDKR